MTEKEKAEEYIIKRYGIDKCYSEKDEETKKCMQIDVHNDFEEEYQCHLDGLADGRKESGKDINILTKENEELKETVARAGYRIAELKHEIDELKSELSDIKNAIRNYSKAETYQQQEITWNSLLEFIN